MSLDFGCGLSETSISESGDTLPQLNILMVLLGSVVDLEGGTDGQGPREIWSEKSGFIQCKLDFSAPPRGMVHSKKFLRSGI